MQVNLHRDLTLAVDQLQGLGMSLAWKFQQYSNPCKTHSQKKKKKVLPASSIIVLCNIIRDSEKERRTSTERETEREAGRP